MRLSNEIQVIKKTQNLCELSVSGGSRISRQGFHIYKDMGGSFADFISFFLNIP